MSPAVTRNGVLVAVGAVLLLTPALVPVQPMLYHYPDPGTTENRTELERRGYEIVAYENLSDRGKELYRRALREGSLAVPVGEGAPDFEYPTSAELGATEDDFEERRRLLSIVIERPPNADLPPAAEPVEMAEELRERRQQRREERRREQIEERDGRTPSPTTTGSTASGNGTATEQRQSPTETRTTPTLDERRETIARYDVMTTRTELPPMTAPTSLARLLAAMLGVVLIGVGGYRHSQP